VNDPVACPPATGLGVLLGWLAKQPPPAVSGLAGVGEREGLCHSDRTHGNPDSSAPPCRRTKLGTGRGLPKMGNGYD